ncbi:MAG: PorV/PorQ family protein [Candidatus Goldbacteria bacterium]|nr:PorV/PorQ family protein [Candidatus Goldiibacteriota bacterium]
MYFIKKFFILFLFCFFSSFIYSYTTGQFLLVSLMARETSLGNIYAANYSNPGASIVNPATLSGMQKTHILFSHFVSVFNTYYEHVLYASPLSEKMNIGFNFLFSTNSDLYRTDENGYPVEHIENYDTLFGSIFSIDIKNNISAGINAKLILSKFNKKSVYGITFNLGCIYRNTEKNYILGLSFENLGISTAYFKEQSMYPFIARMGYTSEIFQYLDIYRIYILIEERIFLNENEGSETSFGLEVMHQNFFVFRYGYIFGREEGRLSLGAGITFQQLKIDYSYQPYFLSDNVHMFTVTIIFN